MCWCRPEVRTPNCGSANCMPREEPEDRPRPKLPPKKGILSVDVNVLNLDKVKELISIIEDHIETMPTLMRDDIEKWLDKS